MNKFSVLTGIPEFTKGFVRELRVRWALQEMGLEYEEVSLSPSGDEEGTVPFHAAFWASTVLRIW